MQLSAGLTSNAGQGFHGFFRPPPDGVEALHAMARRFDETTGRARVRMAAHALAGQRRKAINRTADKLAGLEDAARHRRRMLDDLTVELGG